MTKIWSLVTNLKVIKISSKQSLQNSSKVIEKETGKKFLIN